MTQPLYSIGTWETRVQGFTRQPGLTVPSINIPIGGVRRVLHELRARGYSAHRFRDPDGGHDDNDSMVLVERTDGAPYREILKSWRRRECWKIESDTVVERSKT